MSISTYLYNCICACVCVCKEVRKYVSDKCCHMRMSRNVRINLEINHTHTYTIFINSRFFNQNAITTN